MISQDCFGVWSAFKGWDLIFYFLFIWSSYYYIINDYLKPNHFIQSPKHAVNIFRNVQTSVRRKFLLICVPKALRKSEGKRKLHPRQLYPIKWPLDWPLKKCNNSVLTYNRDKLMLMFAYTGAAESCLWQIFLKLMKKQQAHAASQTYKYQNQVLLGSGEISWQ